MNAEVDKKIGRNLRKLRKSKKLTQEHMAIKLQLEGCDVTRSALAKIEVGQRHLYPDEIIAFKRILEVEFDEILKI